MVQTSLDLDFLWWLLKEWTPDILRKTIWGGDPLLLNKTYPTKREVRKIIGKKKRAQLDGIFGQVPGGYAPVLLVCLSKHHKFMVPIKLRHFESAREWSFSSDFFLKVQGISKPKHQKIAGESHRIFPTSTSQKKHKLRNVSTFQCEFASNLKLGLGVTNGWQFHFLDLVRPQNIITLKTWWNHGDFQPFWDATIHAFLGRVQVPKHMKTFVPSAHGILPNRCRKGGQW